MHLSLAGLLVGISIAHGNILPIRFSRHVLKYLLGRPIAWHDLAFFDPLMYESLRKTIVAATAEGAGAASAFADWGLTFHVDKPAWLGGGSHHLGEMQCTISCRIVSNVNSPMSSMCNFEYSQSKR